MMDCPRCKEPLSTTMHNEVNTVLEIDLCNNCGGIWFDKGELARIDKIIEPQFIEIRKIPRQRDQLEALHCPSCEDHPMMDKAEHPRDKKVILDYCETCKGIWLDKGELEAIQQENWLITVGNMFNWLING